MTNEPGEYVGDGEPTVDASLCDRPAELLQELIRFDTTNPPGAERTCIEWAADLLADAGIDSELYAQTPDRPSLVARLPGGDAPALMLYGHVDVVPTSDQSWTHPPFAGVEEDGYVWGRGALDMKSGVAMFVAAFLRAARDDVDLAGDLVLCLLADEEAGGDEGAAFLVEEHPELFEDVEYALGEFGGYPMELAGARLYPVQVNEKQVCWVRVSATGQAGHASRPSRGDAVGRIGEALVTLDRERLPYHLTPPVEEMLDRMAEAVDDETAAVLRGLKEPETVDDSLAALGDEAGTFEALLHNTANATILSGGDKMNVVPARAEFTVDSRLLPGQTGEDVAAELRDLLGDGVDVKVERFEEGPEETDLGLFGLLDDVLRDADEDAVPVPYVLPAATDGRILARIGVQSYGFTPMSLPSDFDFQSLVHAADERIPVESVEFGTDAVYDVVRRYDGVAE
ncbi:M20/M25/M40 family metallo-hydrolase [Haloprofundus sp. MHR1]|uniref:M20/M25/M40 family metallo-hydrolase n=1 Tax=Haloprofundus sp. MHR1 TaxID=2572921 RepID=UPI0010BF4592|nr:M20/M25/M40 family metallo-hydrolase [Haloprofundus sp. MHR1]QCJ46750.1 M20/M25/M40 family metallo-hydrolase [Haloprofundus sp. MHR1]